MLSNDTRCVISQDLPQEAFHNRKAIFPAASSAHSTANPPSRPSHSLADRLCVLFRPAVLIAGKRQGRGVGAEELTKLVSYNSPVLTAWWRSSRFCPFLFWLIQSDPKGERLVGHGENPGCKWYHVISCLKCPRQPPIS